MKLLIIGANGQVGRSLCDLCDAQSIEYVATTREQLDVTNKNAVTDYFIALSVDFVVNATAYTNVEKAEDEPDLASLVNSKSICWLATECKSKNIPLIHISTDYVFDGTKDGMYFEDDHTNPINVYGQSKLDGENALANTYDKHIIIRVSWVFSEYGNNFVKTMLKLSNSHNKLTVISDQYGSPTSARSIASTVLQVCNYIDDNEKFDNWGVYNYTCFPVTTWHQFATYVIQNNKTAETKSIQPILASQFPVKASRPKNSAMYCGKVKEVFSVQQHSWLEDVDYVITKLGY